ncbi:MAG: hypothetical protein HKN03_07630 [Acidimicrobiales bacterium]|nr:hypothetical protein [Acidimicrobiales bacterium]
MQKPETDENNTEPDETEDHVDERVIPSDRLVPKPGEVLNEDEPSIATPAPNGLVF